jgi:hypothetical protein
MGDLPDDEKVEPERLEAIGSTKYGRLGGAVMTKIVQLCPVYGWEIKQAMATRGESWAYFAKVVVSIREEASKPKPKGSKGGGRPKSNFRASAERMMAIAREEDERHGRINTDGVYGADVPPAGLLPERGDGS